ncbi:CDP-glucose 4,6-dehydratase [Variovorax ginsengisoli]|uniref:CDP-glucose 4,6-dehydratase n=1 Tax=Variovorax ginsengisoli TaxID=363844 RepID=A0ABT9SCV6_9BURK|nr:CDP-glucose 4,6-dehydratase [Variovorax ginsengisoli]MDP9902185.1 CDP-glucose 4,6-dehydratase [Variovorax ginsengisoli]
MSAVQSDFWRGKRVFLTGHTGFKGSWLSLWFQTMGAEVQGFALQPPTTPNLFEQARVAGGMSSTIGDIRDLAAVKASMHAFQPDIVVHMAAQPLVRLSYLEPVETYATNVMGTVHVLEAARTVGSVRAVVNVTTDKCYENREWVWGYREDEPMGGYDPYSNSKGCSELITSAYRRSFFQNSDIALGSGRAGNVIGGGDWAQDRLVPDILRAFERKEPVVIRNPHSTRPWQHVLEPLSGYLVLAERLFSEGQSFAEGWNFGPRDEDAKPVQWIVEHMVREWGEGARWQLDGGEHPHEAGYLKLDISKARQRLGWEPRWALSEALVHIMQWHKAWLAKEDVQKVCLDQISQYMTTMNKESLS